MILHNFPGIIFILFYASIGKATIYSNCAESDKVTNSTTSVISPLTFITSSSCSPGPGKLTGHVIHEDMYASSCGEDAYSHGSEWLGIADGVGGWANMDPKSNSTFFALKLLHHSITFSILFSSENEEITDYIDEAHKRVSSIRGSSTLSMVLLRQNNLVYANLGDSGILVVRPTVKIEGKPESTIVFRSKEQQHQFNQPFQLSYVDPGSNIVHDTARDASRGSIPVKEGDIVIVASDGVYDNLFDVDILSILDNVRLEIESKDDLDKVAKDLAERIVQKAVEYGKNLNRSGPFATNALKNNMIYSGGKPDDTTVVVGILKNVKAT